MSKLSEQIRSYKLNTRTIKFPQPSISCLDIETLIEKPTDADIFPPSFSSYCIYRIGAQFKYEIRLTDNKDIDSELSYVEERARLAIVHEVFGEYKIPLIEAEMACYEGDTDKAAKTIKGILESMFS